MNAPVFPSPDATREQIEAFEAEQRAAAKANRPPPGPRTCSSCGLKDGHRRGDRACPNYDTSERWSDKRAIADRPKFGGAS